LLRVNSVKNLASNRLARWKARARELKQEVHALALACKDPRVPWYAKVLAVCIVAYALSPIDLIPDFIPVLGYLDDLILVPLGIYFLVKMIPDGVMIDCRARAKELSEQRRPNYFAAAVIIAIWMILALWLIKVFWPREGARLRLTSIKLSIPFSASRTCPTRPKT
jgi:uncharacterized membrane protein YkvA (DUF1232 family)